MQRVSLWCIRIAIGLSFFVPLFIVPALFIFPFVVPKVLLFRTMVVIMAGAYLLLAVGAWGTYGVRRTPITISLGVFFVSLILSMLFGVDAYRSFWDSHERMLGVFTIAHYLAYYLIATSVFKTATEWRWLLRLFLFAGGAVMVVALVQQWIPTFLFNHGSGRSIGTLGNPIYVGGYGLFLFFLGLLLLGQETNRAWKIYAVLGAVLGLSGIFTSATRGAVLGLGSGLGVLFLYYLIAGDRTMRFRLKILGGISVVILAGLFMLRGEPWVKRIPAVGSLLTLDIHSGTSATRLMAWGASIDAWQDRPVFGWGPSNFLYAFNAYYRPQFLEYGWTETWFDSAHNIVLNTLTTQGIVGVLSYVGIFCVVGFGILKAFRRGHVSIHAAAILSALCLAHLVQNLFVFENPTSYLFFFFILAYINSTVTPAPSRVDTASKSLSVPFAGAVVVAVLGLIYVTNVNVARANMSMFRVLKDLYALRDPMPQYERTVRIATPHIDDIRSEFSRVATGAAEAYIKAGQEPLAKRLVVLAYEELGRNVSMHPYDVRYYLQQAETTQAAAVLFQRIDLVVAVEKQIEQAKVYSPARQQVWYTIAWIKVLLGKHQEAIDALEHALALDENVGESWWRLALMYQSQQQPEHAKEIVRRAHERGVMLDARGIRIMNSILPIDTTTTPTMAP